MAVFVSGCIALASCARYTPQRLTAATVERSLAVPTPAELHARIAALHNPLIIRGDECIEGGLTPGGAAVIAVVCNPGLAAERNRSALSDAQFLQAGILPNPTLSYNLDAPFGANSAGQVSGYGLGLQWEVTALISHSAKMRAATAAGEGVRLDIAWKEWQVAQAARQAVYDVAALRIRETDATHLEKQLERIVQRARRALRAHDMTLNEASLVEAAAAEARIASASAQRDLRDAELALNRAMGLPPSTRHSLAADVALPARIAVADAPALEKNLEIRRIDLVALRRGYESQEEILRAAVLGQFPKISLGLSHTRDYGDFLTLGPSVTADLPFFDRNQGNIAIEKATRRQLYDEYVARVFEARSDIARAVALIQSLNNLISSQSDDVMTLRRLVDADEAALSHGNLDASTFYTAAVSLAQKQADLVTLKQSLLHTLIALELAAGAYLPDAPQTQPSPPESVR